MTSVRDYVEELRRYVHTLGADALQRYEDAVDKAILVLLGLGVMYTLTTLGGHDVEWPWIVPPCAAIAVVVVAKLWCFFEVPSATRLRFFDVFALFALHVLGILAYASLYHHQTSLFAIARPSELRQLESRLRDIETAKRAPDYPKPLPEFIVDQREAFELLFEGERRQFIERRRAKSLGGHLKTGQSWTGQNRPVGEPPPA
jgi:hypothetical protein